MGRGVASMSPGEARRRLNAFTPLDAPIGSTAMRPPKRRDRGRAEGTRMTTSRKHMTARPWLPALVASATVATLLLVPATSLASPDPSNMVLEWNANAVLSIGNAPTANPPGLGHAPPLSPIELAMVHGAIYDAVNAIDGTHQAYLGGLSAPASASTAAATASAARGVLLGLTPGTLPQVATSIEAMYAASLARITDSAAKTAGIAVGDAAAAAMLANRAGDGRTGTQTWATGTDAGQWRLVAPGNSNVFGYIGFVRPFTLDAPGQYLTEGPL